MVSAPLLGWVVALVAPLQPRFEVHDRAVAALARLERSLDRPLDRERECEGECEGALVEVRSLGIAGLRPVLRARLAEGAGRASSSCAVLRALAAVGTAQDLELLLLASSSLAPERAERRELDAALRAILERDPTASAETARLAGGLRGPAADSWTRALGAGGPEVQLPLAWLLGRDSEQDLGLLTALVSNLRAHGVGPEPERIGDAVRPFLTDDDPQRLREACAIVGALGDCAALPALVEIVGHPNAASSAAAHGALQQLSGLPWGPEPERWRAWLDEERLWFERSAPARLAEVASGQEQRAVLALAEIGRHRYRRDDLALAVADALVDPSPLVRAAACGTLERLDVPAVAPALLPLLEDSRPTVSAAAGRALRALTGEAHGNRELELWRASVSAERALRGPSVSAERALKGSSVER